MSLVVLTACPEPQDDQPPPCPAIAAGLERNPQTGVCEIRNEWECDMGPQPLAPQQPWAACDTACESLDEAACDQNPTCQTAYLDGTFWACWQLNQMSIVDGACDQLDAWSCSTRADCNPSYDSLEVYPDQTGEWGNSSNFAACTADEPAPQLTCANVLCNTGTHCEMLDENGNACLDGEAMPLGCQPACVPDGGGAGSCYGEIFCDGAPPVCPDGTMPGISNGCWTGYCIPLSACEPAPACEQLSNEASCIGRADCAPLYQACGPNELCPDGYKYWGCTGA